MRHFAIYKDKMVYRERRAPQPGAAALVVIPGLSFPASLAEALRDDPALAPYALYQPDLPGFGGSIPCADGPPVAAVVSLLGSWLVSLGTRVVLLGYGCGGLLACDAAVDAPVAGVFAVDTPLLVADAELPVRAALSDDAEAWRRELCAELLADGAASSALAALAGGDAASCRRLARAFVERLSDDDEASRLARHNPHAWYWHGNGREASADRARAEGVPCRFLTDAPTLVGELARVLAR